MRALLPATLGIYHPDVDLHAELDPRLVVTVTIQATPTGPTRDRTFPAEQVRWRPAMPA